MSRMLDYYDQDGTIPEGLWYGALVRTLNGQRGQRLLREVEAALLALPTPELIEGHFLTPEGAVCAVGALALYRGQRAGATREEVIRGWLCPQGEDIPQADDYLDSEAGTVEAGEALGLSRRLAYELAWVNDELYSGLDPAARWAAVLAWVRARIKPNA